MSANVYEVNVSMPPAPELEHCTGSHDAVLDFDCDFCVGRLPEPDEKERARLLRLLREHEAEAAKQIVVFGRSYD